MKGKDMQITEVREFGEEHIEVVFRKAADPSDPESRYPGFNPGTTTLKKGVVIRPGALPLPCDIVFERDVAIPLRDGIVIYADIFRPPGETDLPAIIAWSPFGKGGGMCLDDFPGRAGVPMDATSGLEAWEAPDPAYWCNNGYAVVNPDARGICSSEGNIQFWGKAEAEDGYDVIEWIASRDWCNGKVTLSGNSWLGILQWFIAAEQPPHLAAIAPWEGHIECYRCDVLRGGIPDVGFNQWILSGLRGKNYIEDVPTMVENHPLMNGYWEDKRAKLERISIPAYIVASYHGHHTLDGYRRISSREKWLRVHNTNEWHDYYTPKYIEDLRRFFDHYLKGIENGWEETPRVRVSVYDQGGFDQVDRPEKEWPIPGTDYRRLYLDAEEGTLSTEPPAGESLVRYRADDENSMAAFLIKFERDTELTGYLKLHLWVEAEGSDDMDLFVAVDKLDSEGKPLKGEGLFAYAGPDGRLRVSHRGLDQDLSTEWFPFLSHRSEERLSPGQIVPVEIPVRPTGMFWHKGQQLRLIIAGHNPAPSPMAMAGGPVTRNRGEHIVHTGGRYDSYLLVPEIHR